MVSHREASLRGKDHFYEIFLGKRRQLAPIK